MLDYVLNQRNYSRFTGECIVVITGLDDDFTRYLVHEDILCATSDFFKNAMKGQWKESTEKLINLPNEESEIFAIYVHWIYSRTLPTRVDEPAAAGNEEYLKLAKAYGLADRLQDQLFKNAVIDAFLDKTSTVASDGNAWWPVGPVIRCIYDNTPESSKGRTLLVDIYTNYAVKDWLTEGAQRKDLPKQFLLDLSVKLLDIASGEATRGMPLERCNYHGHHDGKSCNDQEGAVDRAGTSLPRRR